MKKLLLILVLTVASTSVMAEGRHGRHHNGYHNGGWVAPAIIGGFIGYSLSRPYYEPYSAPPTIVYTQPPQTYCTRYIYQDQFGNVTREETVCK